MQPFIYDFYEPPFMDTVEPTGSLFGIVFGVYFAACLLSYAYAILVYIFHALGLYTLANRRGIHHPWLAWVPFGNLWILGSIADQYQYVAKGRVKNRRKVLIGLSIALMALLLVLVGGILAMVITAFDSVDSQPAMGALAVMGISLLAVLVVSILAMVYEYICYYNLYTSSDPGNGVAYLVLSIFFTFLIPFLVFACRKKDLGMPPRRPQTPVSIQPPATEGPVEEEVREEPEEL